MTSNVLAIAIAGASLTLASCVPSTLNVRATRAYANEAPNAACVLDRAADLEQAVALADELLAQTPYAPGDAWVGQLALDDPKANGLRASIQRQGVYADGEHEVPIVKLYALQVAWTLRSRPQPPAPAAHPSLLDAAATLGPGLALLRDRWVAMGTATLAAARQPGLEAQRAAAEAERLFLLSTVAVAGADLTDPARAAIARDVLTALSVALRMAMEGGALVSTVRDQAAEVAQGSRDLFITEASAPPPEVVALPPRLAVVEAELAVRERSLTALVRVLAAKWGEGVRDTPGFALRESILDQVAGVQIDSTHARVKADSELLFYHVANSAGGTDEGTSFAGRTRRLSYDVDPIVLVGGRVIATYDWIHLKDAASLHAGFVTDRLWSEGGDIVNDSSLGARLGIDGFASDLFDLGIGLLGVRTSYKVARFSPGSVHEVAIDPATGKDAGIVGTAPLELHYEQFDLGYDLAFLMPEVAPRYWLEELLVGFRTMSYDVPRVVYELDSTPAPGGGTQFTLGRESPPQLIESRYYMGGVVARFGQGERRRVSLFADIGAYVGSGPASYYFLKNPLLGDVPGNRDETDSSLFVVDGTASLGVRVRLTPKQNSRFRVLLEGQYHGEVIHQAVITKVHATTSKNAEGETVTSYAVGQLVDFGGTDLFHGPRLQLAAVF